jgi:hypothetical protein
MNLRSSSGFAIGALLGTLLLWSSPAQDARVGSTSPAASTTTSTTSRQGDSEKPAVAQANQEGEKSQSPAGETGKHSAGVDEILQIVQGGVSTEVIKDFIENSRVPYNLSADDIIALKSHSVPDELTRAMIKRGATLMPASRAGKAPAYSGSRARPAPLDPDSYDYFQYYYLYPRTLAAANQRLYSSYPYSSFGYSPYSYGYGYYGPSPFNPYGPSAFRH